MTSGVRMRHARPDDRPALVRFMAALQDNERGIEPDVLLPGAEMADSHVAHLLDIVARHDGVTLIAEDEATGEALGFLIAYVEEDHGTYLVQEARSVGRVTDLFVVPAARRRGLAHGLIRAAEEHFRALGIQYMQIGVLAGNVGAQAVYTGAGYRDWLHLMMRKL